MNRPFLTSVLATLTMAALAAQSMPDLNPADTPDPEAVAEAIRKFKTSRGMPADPKAVTVDLTTATTTDKPEESEKSDKPDASDASAKPDESAPPPAATPGDEPPAAATAPDPDAPGDSPEPGDASATPDSPAESLTVKVEQLETGSGPIDPAKVKLLAPFPAKPLGNLPAGWKLDSSAPAPLFTRSVEIAADTSITLSIKPHVLVPAADGTAAFSVSEPGFDPAHGYQQVQTVGAVLSRSIEQLDEDAKLLGNAIEQLQQLVGSLPKPEPKPEPKPDSKPKPSNKR